MPEYGNAIEDHQEELLTLYEKLGGNKNGDRNPFGWQDELLDGVSASERHNTAVRLAGRWAMKGFSRDEVALFIPAWNKRNRPPKPDLADPESKELKDIIHYAFVDTVFGAGLSSPQALIQELNEKHAVVDIGGKCSVMNERIDPVSNRAIVSFSSKNDFMNFYRKPED